MPAVPDDLTQALRRAAGLSPDQADLVVAGLLRYLAARLPSPLFGELRALLALPDDAAAVPPPAP